MADMCGDNRFEIIEAAKKDLIEATNIETSPEEMAVLDNILFRMWQMDWLPVHAHWTIIYESTAGVTDAKCSNCGFESLAYENDVHTDENCNYCPCCGAKMDEEVS